MTDSQKLDFAKKVAFETEGLIAFVANLAIEQNEYDHFFHVLNEQFRLDAEKFKSQLGEHLFSEFLEFGVLE
jgi:hypothetical protein